MATKPTVAPEKDEKPPVNPDATTKPADGEVPDAELAGLAENVKATLFGEKKRPVPEKKAEPEKKPEAAAKPTEGAVATADAGKTPDAKPTPAKPAKKPKTTREETDETIGKTARATAEAVARELRQPETTEESVEVPEGELSPEDQSDLNGFKKLEQLNPQRKGIAERFVQFVEAREEYEANWLKENPGKEFDPDADEHNDFFKKYAEFDSPHTAAELEDAKIELKLDKRFEERLKPMEEQRRVEQVKRQVQPMIAREVVSRVKSLADKVSPELSKQLVDDKGNFRFTDETMKKLSEDFPVEYAALEELVTGKKDHSGKIIPQTSLIELLSVLEQMPYRQHTGFRLNPQDPVHGRVIDYMRDYEQHMETAPADAKFQTFTDKTGQKTVKQFIATQEFVELQNQILARKVSDKVKQRQLAELDHKYWTVGVDALEDIIIDELAAAAKTQIAKVNKLVERKSGKIPEPRTFSQPPRIPAATARQEKPQPPSVHTADVVSTTDTGADGKENLAENVGKTLFGTT